MVSVFYWQHFAINILFPPSMHPHLFHTYVLQYNRTHNIMLITKYDLIHKFHYFTITPRTYASWTSTYPCTLWFPHVSYITLSKYLSPDHTEIRVIPVWWQSGLARQATHEYQNWIQQYSFNLAYKLALVDRSPKISSFIECNFWYMYVFHDYLGLSRLVTSMNFLSKQDTSQFSKVAVSHTSGLTSN
jgi:hypothetical protein